MTDSTTRLRGENLTLGYGKKIIARNLSVAIPDGHFTAIIGPNGCGKSTLLRTLSRLMTPVDGSVFLDGEQIQRREGVLRLADFLIAGVAEEPDADDDITRKRQPLLGIHELLFEAGAATERDYFIFSYHLSFSILRSAVLPLPVQHVHLYRLLMSEPARARQRYVQ